MANLPVTRKEFQNAGRSRLEAAGFLLGLPAVAPKGTSASRSKPSGAKVQSQLAAYLVQVGLECWLKARILVKANVDSSGDYEQKFPTLSVFKTSRGHNLEFLSTVASLGRLLCDDGKPRALLEDPCWQRMSKEPRPYSLRYGTASVTTEHAHEEVERAIVIADVLERNLWPVKNK